MKENSVNLIELAKGAMIKRIDEELPKILDNITDLKTKANKKRTLTITIDFYPNEERNKILMSADVKSKIEPIQSISTSLEIIHDYSTGEQMVVELVPNIPGQFDIDGEEQESPKILRLVR